MKLHTVMILDDEEWIVRGLAEMLDWEEQGFTVAGQFTDPEQALQSIRALEPDLLLLDIHMPKLSGGVLMDMIREEGIPTEFIILSGYSDFSVSQKAINHGAYGYLLKPLKTQEMMAALRRVKRTLEEREQKEIAIPIDPMNYEAFFQHAWRGREAVAESGKAYQLILSDDGGTGHLPAFEGAVTSRAVSVYGGKVLYMVVSRNGNDPCNVEALKKHCQKEGIPSGVSLVGDSLMEYHNMFRQANCALCCAKLQKRSDCYLYTPPNLTEVARWLNTLQKLYEERDSEKLRWEISRLADQWKAQGNPASVLMLISQLTYSVIPSKKLGSKERGLNLEKFLYDDISSKFSNIAELFDYLTQLLSTDQSDDEDLGQIPTTVSDIKEYLHQHYSEPVTLSHIARKFYLTPSYLCEVFKKFTGCTITGYLLRMRMEKASEFLLETELSLADVASQVSYSDYNYFCRLFKRYYNVPPAAYRKEKREMHFS